MQADAGKRTLLLPAIVSGFPTFRARPDLPYTFRSLVGLTSATLAPATFTLTYADQQSGASVVRTVTVQPRETREYKNVVEELFGVAPGTRSQGPVFVEADSSGLAYAKVYSDLGNGSLGDAFPVLDVTPVASEGLVGAGSMRPVFVDGLEQSVDEARGTRSNLILNEVIGKPATVTVRLYEAGNRSEPIAERDVFIGALGKVQLSTVFSGLGLDTGTDYVDIPDPRRKDRTNVLCVVEPKSGDGLVSAVVTTIDNRTGDTRNALLTPSGGVTATAVPSIGF